jgi:CheY-like chemotaxis protein
MGYEVELAADGAEGIELYKNARDSGRPFQAVIMDLTIPGGMGGEQAIRELVEIDPHAKVIVSSGYSNDPLMSNFREYGFSGVVQKPYTIEDLAAVLHKVIMEVDCPHTIEI